MRTKRLFDGDFSPEKAAPRLPVRVPPPPPPNGVTKKLWLPDSSVTKAGGAGCRLSRFGGGERRRRGGGDSQNLRGRAFTWVFRIWRRPLFRASRLGSEAGVRRRAETASAHQAEGGSTAVTGTNG
ncbi:hypothetical protein SKAU_G00022440 [Synaphobranchus kaupii]|uniref:Uncharacterized protein n=1 Tax=Synaphobranchus kaupii TaxID=118154 RepID=A0A9Q1GC25_SYNKA|nr:hypothetical protein SKAU_G00022440 [Synaphobranchus kaupii]